MRKSKTIRLNSKILNKNLKVFVSAIREHYKSLFLRR